MEVIRQLTSIYFDLALLCGLWFLIRSLPSLLSDGVVKTIVVVTLCAAAWPYFIRSRYF